MAIASLRHLLQLILFAVVFFSVESQYIAYNTSQGIVPGKLNVHIVAHTHDDVGWLKTIDQYYVGSNNSIQVSSILFSLIFCSGCWIFLDFFGERIVAGGMRAERAGFDGDGVVGG